MTKVTVTIELDEQSYRAKYGPGSEHWAKYNYDSSQGPDGEWVKTVKPASDYKPMEGKLLHHAIIDILHDGFYDWTNEGWLKVEIDGKAVRGCCQSLEGEAHQSYCETVAGAEQSLD